MRSVANSTDGALTIPRRQRGINVEIAASNVAFASTGR